MIEKERKFILKDIHACIGKCVFIKQAYLIIEGNKHLRVRIINNKTAFLCFKDFISNEVRNEYEYEIPITDGLELYEGSNLKLTKVRFNRIFEGNHVDIDLYLNGLKIVEIEFENELTTIPDFCGEEITGSPIYSNIHIARFNLVKPWDKFNQTDNLSSLDLVLDWLKNNEQSKYL